MKNSINTNKDSKCEPEVDPRSICPRCDGGDMRKDYAQPGVYWWVCRHCGYYTATYCVIDDRPLRGW